MEKKIEYLDQNCSFSKSLKLKLQNKIKKIESQIRIFLNDINIFLVLQICVEFNFSLNIKLTVLAVTWILY